MYDYLIAWGYSQETLDNMDYENVELIYDLKVNTLKLRYPNDRNTQI